MNGFTSFAERSRFQQEMGAAPGEGKAFEEGVGGQAVGAVDAGVSYFAYRVKAGDGGPTVGVGADAAHPIMGCGIDRNGVTGPVEVAGAGFGVDGGEAFG